MTGQGLEGQTEVVEDPGIVEPKLERDATAFGNPVVLPESTIRLGQSCTVDRRLWAQCHSLADQFGCQVGSALLMTRQP